MRAMFRLTGKPVADFLLIFLWWPIAASVLIMVWLVHLISQTNRRVDEADRHAAEEWSRLSTEGELAATASVPLETFGPVKAAPEPILVRLKRRGPLVAAALGVLLMVAGGAAREFGIAFLGCLLIIAAVTLWTWWQARGSRVWKTAGFGFLAWIVTVPIAAVVAPPKTTPAGPKVASWSEWCTIYSNADGSLKVEPPDIRPAVLAAEGLSVSTDATAAREVGYAVMSVGSDASSYAYSNSYYQRSAAEHMTKAAAVICKPSTITTPLPTITVGEWAGPAIPEGTPMTADEWCDRYIEIDISLYFGNGTRGLYPILAEGADPRQAFADLQAITDRRPGAAVFEEIRTQIFPYRDRAFEHSKAGYQKLSSLLTRVDLVGAAPVPRSSSTATWWGYGGGANGLCFVAEPWVAVPPSVTSGSGSGGRVTDFDGGGCTWNGRPRATWKIWRWGDWSC
jgi:hypothetical protein